MEILAVIIGMCLFGAGYLLGSDYSYAKGYAHALLHMHDQGLISLELEDNDEN